MAEIVCTSCSHVFESDAAEGEEVVCPECGHAQPVAAASDVADTGDKEASTPEEDPFDGIEEEMVFDMDDDEESALTETADFGSVLPSEQAEAAPEAEATPEAEEEDTRWRFRSGSGLVLFFPTYEVASKWVIKQNPADISIAYGSGDFRSYSSFEAQLKTTGDPMAAILSEPLEEEPSAADVEGEDTPGAPGETYGSGDEQGPAAEVSPPAAKDRGGDGESARVATMTSEFQFRTAKDVNVWPGRILFLVLGILLGGGGVYYAAWYGMLPGILY